MNLSQRAMYLALWWRFGGEPLTLSQAKLALEFGTDVRTIQRAEKAWVEAGWAETERLHRSRSLTLSHPTPAPSNDTGPVTPRPGQKEKGPKRKTRYRQVVTNNGIEGEEEEEAKPTTTTSPFTNKRLYLGEAFEVIFDERPELRDLEPLWSEWWEAQLGQQPASRRARGFEAYWRSMARKWAEVDREKLRFMLSRVACTGYRGLMWDHHRQAWEQEHGRGTGSTEPEYDERAASLASFVRRIRYTVTESDPQPGETMLERVEAWGRSKGVEGPELWERLAVAKTGPKGSTAAQVRQAIEEAPLEGALPS